MAILHDRVMVSPVLVGRFNEFMAVRLFIDRARTGQGQIVFISGEAGIGKSRLVAESVSYAVAQGFLPLQGDCFQLDTNHPYAPFQDLLRNSIPAAATDQTLSHEAASLLAELTSSSNTDTTFPYSEQRKQRLFDRLRRLFFSAMSKRPLVLVIEDLHWSDDTSLEFLYYLARQCVDQPIIFLLTYRSEESSPRIRQRLAEFDHSHLAQKIILERLTYTEMSALLRAILLTDQAASPEFIGAIHSLTDGNPFFAEEILRSLIITGDLSYRDGSWSRRPVDELRIPPSIQDAVQQHFENLTARAQYVMTLAAVIGRRFDFDLLQNLTHLEENELIAVMKELVGTQLVAEETPDRFTFRHALARQAIYGGLLARERKKLHQHILEVLESRAIYSSDPSVADLSYHAFEAGDWTRALNYSLIAGEQAQSFYAPRTALEHFMRVQHSTERLSIPPPDRLFRARGLAFEAVGEFQRALTDLEKALALSQDGRDRQLEWQALIDLGMLWASQNYAKAGEYYQRAFELARQINDQKTLGHSLNRMGNWLLNLDRPVDAHWHHQEALAIFENLDDKRGVAETLDLLGMASYLGGNLTKGTDYYRKAITLFRELDDRRGLVSSLATLTMRGPTCQTDTLNTTGRLTEAARDGETAIQIAHDTGQRADEAYGLIFLSLCQSAQGNYGKALSLAHDALAISVDIDHGQWITASNFALGAIHLDILAPEVAQRYLERALALANDSGSLHWIHSSVGLLALVYLEQHQFERAERLLNQTVNTTDPIRTLGHRLIWRANVELALCKEDAIAALFALDRLSDSLSHTDSESPSARLLKLRGEIFTLLDRYSEAEKALQTASEAALAQGMLPLQWRIQLSLAQLQYDQKHYRQADQHLQNARALVNVLSAEIPDQLLKTLFQQNATAMTSRSAKISTGGLTQREWEVATLIAQGKSSRQIAEDLVVGDRTIESHVSNILSKLGFTTRAQIAVWVVEQGLSRSAE